MEREQFINVGFGNFVARDRIIAILDYHSLPARRLKSQAEKELRLLDATAGRKTRSLLVTESHCVLSGLASHTIQERLENRRMAGMPEQENDLEQFIS